MALGFNYSYNFNLETVELLHRLLSIVTFENLHVYGFDERTKMKILEASELHYNT